jgi:class 3 adenylate cyclase/tetratricopeptide (TPR) repeat protein
MPVSERRIVTVLFTDLSGFTHLAENMDPEDVTDLLNGLFSRVRVIIEREGGIVDKFIGDAVMAVFGAPLAHEDDPLRAVRAGLEIQRDVARFNRERSLDLRLRVGINTGEALWGSVAGDRATAMGDAVNIAQRMESAARPGGILVSAPVVRATRHAVRYRSSGHVTLKGRTETVETWEAVEERSAAAAVVLPHIGRETEIARVMDAAESGRGAFFWVHGEPGLGKSRLLGEIATRLARRNPATWIGSGRAADGARSPLSAFAEVARRAAGDLPPREWLLTRLPAAGEGGLEPAVAARLMLFSCGLPHEDGQVDIPPARVDAEARGAWIALFRSIASAGPALIALEDMHEADEGTIALLEALARDLAGAPLVILAESRAGLPPAGFSALPIPALSAAEAAQLARLVLGRPASGPLVALALERSAGNPLFFIELLRHLDAEALVEGNPATLPPGTRMPDGLTAVLTARLDALDADAREAVKRASVAGRVFWRSLLEATGPLAEGALDRAVAGEILVQKPEGSLAGEQEFEFRNALFRDAAYSLLPKKDRQRFHAAAAAWLERASATGDRRLKRLAAAQAEAAGDGRRAATLFFEASQGAEAARAFAEAASAAEECLRLGGDPRARLVLAGSFAALDRLSEAQAEADRVCAEAGVDAETRSRARILSVATRCRLGRREGLDELAEECVRDAPTPDLQARAWREVAGIHFDVGRYPQARRAVEEGLARISGDESRAARFQRALLVELRGLASFREGRNDESLADLRQSVTLLRDGGDPVKLGVALGSLGSTLRALGRLHESVEMAREAVSIQRGTGNRLAACIALNILGVVLRQLGHAEEALEAHRESLAYARALGLSLQESEALASIGNALNVLGRPVEGRASHLEAAEVAVKGGYPSAAVTPLGNLLDMMLLEWDLAGAAPVAARIEELARGTADRRVVLAARRVAANFRSAMGHHEEALAVCEEVAREFTAMGRWREVYFTLRSVAVAQLSLGMAEKSLATSREAMEIAERIGIAKDAAMMVVLEAQAHAALGRAGKAMEVAEEAVRRADAAGGPGVRAFALAEQLSLCIAARDPRAGALAARLTPLVAGASYPSAFAALALEAAAAGRAEDSRQWLARIPAVAETAGDWEIRRALAEVAEARRLLGEGP